MGVSNSYKLAINRIYDGNLYCRIAKYSFGFNGAAAIDGASTFDTLVKIKIPMVMPSITICTFLTLTNTFKMFDQNLALTNGAPDRQTEMLALNIYNTFYGRSGWQGVGQAKAVIFFLIVAIIAFAQLKLTKSKELEQ